jgi:hypothetical protein
MKSFALVCVILFSMLFASDASAQCANGVCGPVFPVANRVVNGVRYTVSPAFRQQFYSAPRFYAAPVYRRPVFYAPRVVFFGGRNCANGQCR